MCVCVFTVGDEGEALNERPTGGNEQAAANHIAYAHAANDDWRRKGGGGRGGAGSPLKAQVASFSEIEACVQVGVLEKQKEN